VPLEQHQQRLKKSIFSNFSTSWCLTPILLVPDTNLSTYGMVAWTRVSKAAPAEDEDAYSLLDMLKI